MRWFILVLLFLGMVINYADKSIIGLAAVQIMAEFNLSYAEWGIIGSSYYWLYPVTGILGAALADKMGAKKILGFLMLTWAVLQFGVLAITALPLLIVYRVLLGVFEAPFAPITYNHADKWFAPKERGLANSVIVSGATVGAMIIAPILVALIAILGWKAAFAVLGTASIVWFVVFQFFTKESPAGVGKEKLPIKKVKLEKFKLKDFLLVLTSPTALFTTLAYFSTYFLVVWIAVWLPIYLVDVVKMSATQMGFGVALIGLSSVVIYVAVSMLSDYLYKKNPNWRVSRVYPVAGALILGALFMASITFFNNPIWVIVAMCLAKGLTYAILPIGPTIMINELPERGGLMASILTTTGNLAGIIAPFITGTLVSLAGANKIAGYNISILFMAGLVLIFGILFAIFVKPDMTKKTSVDLNKEKVENAELEVSSTPL